MNKFLFRFLTCAVLLFAVLSTFSCKSSQKAVRSEVTLDTTLLRGEWQLVEMRGEVFEAKASIPTLQFDLSDMRYFGSTGCNRYFGSLLFNGDQLNEVRFGDGGMTRMACPDVPHENKYMQLFPEVNTVSIVKGPSSTMGQRQPSYLLMLHNAKGDVIAKFSR